MPLEIPHKTMQTCPPGLRDHIDSMSGYWHTTFSKSPLSQAAYDGRNDIVKLMLEAGADVNRVQIFGMTPLLNALSNGHVEVVQTLLKAGARADARDSGRTSALMYAVDSLNPALVEMILEQNVDITHRDINKNTALRLARCSGNVESAILLMERGAVPDFRYFPRRSRMDATLANYKKIRSAYLWRRLRKALWVFGIGNYIWKKMLARTLAPNGPEHAKLVQEAGALFGVVASS